MAAGNNRDAPYLDGLMDRSRRYKSTNPLVRRQQNDALPVVLDDLFFEAIGEIVSQRNTSNTGANTAIFTYPATPTQGNLLIACLSWRSNATISSIPSGWLLATNGGDQSGVDSAIYYKVAEASEPTSHTFTFSAAIQKAGGAFEFSGVTALDKTNSNIGGTTAGTTGATGVLSSPNELVIALFANIVSTETWSAHDNNLTEIAEVASANATASANVVLSVGSKVATVTDSVDYGATLSLARSWSSAVATFMASSAGGGDVTVNLTGQSLSVSAGTLSGSLTVNASGQSVTISQDNVVAGQTTIVNLTGQSLSVALGSLNKSTASPLTGQSVTINAGSLTGLNSQPITGIPVLLSGGSVASSRSVAMSGQSATIQQGSVNKSLDKSITGQAGSVAQGSIVAALQQPISGQSLTISQGNPAKSQSVSLTGQSVALFSGSVTAASSFNLTGSQLSISSGVLTVEGSNDITIPLTGQSISVSVGLLPVSITRAMTGQSVSVAKGIVIATVSSQLIGQQATGSIGNLSPSFTRSLSGQQSTAAQGNVSNSASSVLTGQQLEASSGALSVSTARSLTGQSATISRGPLIADTSLFLTGHALSMSSDSLRVGYSVGLSGEQVTVSMGTLNAFEGNPEANLIGMSVSLGLGSIYPRVKRFIRGEYSRSTINAEEFAAASINGIYIKPTIRGRYVNIDALPIH